MTRGGSSGGAPGSAGTAGPGSTSDERRAGIDRRLDNSIGTLDREVRKEQEKTAQERDARAAANAGSSGSGDGDSENKDGDSGTASTEGPNGGDGKDKDRKSRPGDLKSDKDRKAEAEKSGGGSSGGSNNGGAQGSGDSKTEIPDGSDDDIVARRLRKAAEAETDPELKEKLWKEYIEYKKGAGK
jgi:hypothetical protein